MRAFCVFARHVGNEAIVKGTILIVLGTRPEDLGARQRSHLTEELDEFLVRELGTQHADEEVRAAELYLVINKLK